MAADPYLQEVALLVEKGFKLSEIWEELPWEGDMPEDYISAFAEIYKRFDSERVQKLI